MMGGVSRLSHLPAALFAMAFFAALPAWFLSTQQGPVDVSCDGAARRCHVSTWVFFETRTGSYEVASFALQSQRTGRSRSLSFRLVLEQPGGTRVPLTDWYTAPPDEARAALQAALDEKRTVSLGIPPSGVFWFAVGLTVLFGLVGFAIPMLSGGASPASVSRGRPE